MVTDETPWLDDEEKRTWIAFLFSTRLLTVLLERDLQRDSHVPFSYYEILVVLSEVEGRSMRMSDLALAMQMSRSRLSQAVAKLEADGWVQRTKHPTDRRGAVAVLTDQGFAVLEAAAPGHVRSVRTHLFDQLSAEELRQLREISERLLAHLVPALGLSPGLEAPGPLLALTALGACPPPPEDAEE